MKDFYLITGFLGAGKTTFLKGFLTWLAPRKTQIIVNEFGKVGVDGSLLAQVDAAVHEIAGGSIFCTCRQDHFDSALSAVLDSPVDAVVVEASGLSDPAGIRQVLAQPRFAQLAYKGCICLVDAPRFERVYETARPCRRQLSVSDAILINKADLSTPEQLERIRQTLSRDYPGAKVYQTSWGQFDPAWLQRLRPASHEGEKAFHSKDLTLQKALIRIREDMTLPQLEHFLKLFAEDTYRIKGRVLLGGSWYLADCTGAFVQVLPWDGPIPPEGSALVALAGKGMPLRRSVKQAMAWYPELTFGLEMG